MKKYFLIFAISITFVSMVVFLNAQDNNQKTQSPAKGKLFVDKNNDGVCDNYSESSLGNGQGKGKAAGLCDGTGNKSKNKRGNRNGQGFGKTSGSNFTDANNDGVCDHRYSQKDSTQRNGNGRRCRGNR